MRFGKKRGWASVSRLSADKEQLTTSDRVAAEERQALLTEQPEEEPMAPPQDEETQIAGDPIQQLFTTLGKFSRHINQAQHASNPSEWCDECMNELMVALKISIAGGWAPVKEALIDTARVLHSYERANAASLCISFLKDSYEILSLMVGDLIVDTVRAGVKQKWREHYAKAVQELEAHGIVLVMDEEEQEAAAATRVPERQVAARAQTQTASETKPEPLAQTDPRSSEFEAAAENWVETREESSSMPDVDLDGPALKHEDVPFDLPPLSEPPLEEDAEEPSLDLLHDIVPFPTPKTPRESHMDEAALDREEASPPDSLEETLDLDETFEEAKDSEEASEDALSRDAAPGESEFDEMSLFKDAPEEEAPLETPLFEKAAEEEAPLETPLSEKAAEEEAPPPAPAPAVHEESLSGPEALLRRAQAAMSKGDIGNARTVALELAAAMAQLEFEAAKADLAAQEQLLLDNARAIDQAEAESARIEQALAHTEESLDVRNTECGTCRERIGMIDEEMDCLSAELKEVEAQIAALQERRAEQLKRIEAKQSEREHSIDEESRIQTEMEALVQEVEAARSQLEEARALAKRRVAERRDIENGICAAREEAARRSASLDAIARTLGPVPGADSADDEDAAPTLL